MTGNEAAPMHYQEEALSPVEKQRLISFFNVLIKIDSRLQKQGKRELKTIKGKHHEA